MLELVVMTCFGPWQAVYALTVLVLAGGRKAPLIPQKLQMPDVGEICDGAQMGLIRLVCWRFTFEHMTILFPIRLLHYVQCSLNEQRHNKERVQTNQMLMIMCAALCLTSPWMEGA